MAYPHTRFRYKVEIDGLDAGGFSEVTGFDASIDVVEYREGDMVTTPQKVPGLKNMIFGGEGLFNTVLTGPGKVWLQTMPIYNVANAIRPYIPTKSD